MNVGLRRSADESALSKYLTPEIPVPSEAILHIVDLNRVQQSLGYLDISVPKEWISLCERVTAAVGGRNTLVCDLYSSVSWRRLQDVPWHLYPVLLDAAYKLSLVPETNWVTDRFRQQDTFLVQDAISAVDAVVIHVPEDSFSPRWSEMVAKILFAFGKAGRTDGIQFADRSGAVRNGSLDELALMARAAPWSRFEYSYAQNFSAIAGKALKAALPLPRSADLWGRAMRSLEQPLALQLLYRLQERGNARIVSSRGGDTSIFLPADGKDDVLWAAGSKYLSARIPAWRVFPSVMAMENIGLIECTEPLGPGSECQLTSAGRRFLALLHPRCSDPDMLCRWSGRELDAQDAAAMDEWIVKFFRRMKTRVNAVVV